MSFQTMTNDGESPILSRSPIDIQEISIEGIDALTSRNESLNSPEQGRRNRLQVPARQKPWGTIFFPKIGYWKSSFISFA